MTVSFFVKPNWHGKKCLRVGVISTVRGLTRLRQPQSICDLIEVRLDYLLKAKVPLEKVKTALIHKKNPVLLTLRASDEGGQLQATPLQRLSLLMPLLPYVDAVDIEYRHRLNMKKILSYSRKKHCGLILSAHFFDRAPSQRQWRTLLQQMKRVKAEIYKVATVCSDLPTLNLLLAIQKRQRKGNVALMGMGKLASQSRSLLIGAGTKLVYGYLDAPTAPSQPHIQSIKI